MKATKFDSTRCIKWMRDVIDVHMDMCYGERPTDMSDTHLQSILDAEYIIKCIRVRTPKKPIHIGYCPNCEERLYIDEFDNLPNYCNYCGQAIDWSDN